MSLRIGDTYDPRNDVTLYTGDCLNLLATLPDSAADLIVTSPPYNLGKCYETNVELEEYLRQQERVIRECVRVLSLRGSLCWQVGNYVDEGAIIPLDTILYPFFVGQGLRMRNRIVWHYEHGLHCKRRLSGRYEVIVWFTRTDSYLFNVDPIRVPQKYPGKKAFRGTKAGQFSCNPKGKNPGDVWIFPNVKHNHCEKTEHPCQFPVELVERLVLCLTEQGSLVVDPFLGVGTTAVAAVRHKRRAAGADIVPRYIEIARERIWLAAQEKLPVRPMDRKVYSPSPDQAVARSPFREIDSA